MATDNHRISPPSIKTRAWRETLKCKMREILEGLTYCEIEHKATNFPRAWLNQWASAPILRLSYATANRAPSRTQSNFIEDQFDEKHLTLHLFFYKAHHNVPHHARLTPCSSPSRDATIGRRSPIRSQLSESKAEPRGDPQMRSRGGNYDEEKQTTLSEIWDAGLGSMQAWDSVAPRCYQRRV